MKIGLLEPLRVTDDLLEELVQPLKDAGHEFVSYDEKAKDEEELYERSKDLDIVIIANRPYPASVIERLDQTKYIDVAFTGVNHVGMDAANKKDIVVSNASGYANRSVPELSLALTLGLYRHLVTLDQETRATDEDLPLIQGQEIAGKTVGIIGTGKLGIATAKLFKAFGAKLIGYSRTEKDEAKELGLTYHSLEKVMAESDIISIHLAQTKETEGLISKEQIARMKKSAILINVARGPIVDNDALAEALNEEKIAGAGIDVYDQEPPLPADYPLLKAKNTLLTPHVGFLTDEAMVKRARIAFENVEAFLDGEPQNVMSES
ncbi:MAG: 2-hydroxyacid dehydrogenase [Aerococcus sp.]|nr:2-hydroxyacid dehydrogenase [Aerococcus sp.]